MKIVSFDQAKQCIDDLREFLDFADKTISGVSLLKGESKQLFQPGTNKAKPTNGSEPEPRGWTDGVLKLLKSADKPLRAVDVLERWASAGWEFPPEDRRKFYIGINGGLQYLLRKGIVEKSDGKYTIKG
jgi:hypothetical protein